MEKVYIIARFKINDGKLAEFKQGKEACIALTKNENGAIRYDWFLDEQNLFCTAIETYQNSDAVLNHVGNVDPALSKLMEISDFSAEVFGDVSKELNDALAEMGITPAPYIGGI